LAQWPDVIQPKIFTDGDGDFSVAGIGFAQWLVSGAGNDRFTLDGGDVTIYGGSGNDRYFVTGSGTVSETLFDASAEQPDETVDAGGYDEVISSVADYELPNFVERLTLTELAFAGYGNDGANDLIGSDRANWLDGGAGNDRIVGGLGNDQLIGGGGSDAFFFGDGATGADSIADFGQDDLLITSTAIFDRNGDGVIGFGRNKLLDFTAGGSVEIYDEAGKRVTELAFLQSYTADDQIYYAYGFAVEL
jgi:serralysin